MAKITSGSNTVDIPVCILSGAVNLEYNHEPQPADVLLDVIDLHTSLESVLVQSQLYMQQKGKVFQIDLEEMKAFIGITSFMVTILFHACKITGVKILVLG